MDDALDTSGLALADAIRSRAVSAVEVVDRSIERIDALDQGLGAFVEVFRRRSRRRADAVDREVARGEARGAFVGVPYAIKDLDAVRFARFQAGSRHFRHVWSPVDAPQVSRQRDSGVVLMGKTATSEFGLLPTVETDVHPPARNPWNPEFLSGGSSGGAATAVAAGLLPLAQGSDGGGSIRIPAALCHLFGFKCSRGLTPDFYGRMDPFGLAVIGALTHTVDDAAAMLDVLCERSEAGLPGSLLEQSRREPPRGLRIRLTLESPAAEVEPDIRAGVLRVARLLEDLGHHVEPATVPPGSLDDFLPIYQRFAAGIPAVHEGWLQPATRWLREAGRKVDPALARERVTHFERLIRGVLGDADLMLSPTTPCFAPRVGRFDGLSGEAHFRQAAELGVFTAVVNCSGQPAASVPAGLGGPDRLPFGAHLVGHLGQDVQVLQVCRQLERALLWTRHRAPVVRENVG